MCGICGIYHFDPKQRVEERAVRSMVEAIRHRGPDDRGFFFDENLGLGHLRLSIIDLSPAAHQPMTDESGRYQIIYNGEIYNYVELRAALQAQGHTFRTQADTEVLAHLYEQHRLDLFAHLRGMYAFALWDARAERLVLAVGAIARDDWDLIYRLVMAMPGGAWVGRWWKRELA